MKYSFTSSGNPAAASLSKITLTIRCAFKSAGSKLDFPFSLYNFSTTSRLLLPVTTKKISRASNNPCLTLTSKLPFSSIETTCKTNLPLFSFVLILSEIKSLASWLYDNE